VSSPQALKRIVVLLEVAESGLVVLEELPAWTAVNLELGRTD
jgi:hypothetical protein